MESVLLEILNALIPSIVIVLSSFLAWIGNSLNKYYKEKTREETVRNIVESTVKYVEQVFTELKGQEKLKKAKVVALDWLNQKGIDISDAELIILIESFVNSLYGK